ncbi:FMN-binding glutamate synthase family protein [Arachidicoccus soli]|uniref:FMN-binding glutamate synthase family protein n=1 Tax=Arachidicoccus soli TaxID=2341117 RepID=A0A386HMV8_9BACT|nr:FMN-binding glutamate synthase family protein [Arachidicoccus soli]AYD46860.1 FMN-binding glutamate synthase family protein [Arachidicoccus soli]
MSKKTFFIACILAIGLIAVLMFVADINWIWLSVIIVPLIALGIYDLVQKKNSVLRNFPIIGHMRYLLKDIGPELHQYFVEDNTDGTPFNANKRNYVESHATKNLENHPFGTELNIYKENYDWMEHSIYAAEKLKAVPRVNICGSSCQQPYSASIFNISAMSFGALSPNAIEALNLAAKEGNFFHDTGEGGISKYHRKGGDLVWEIGTAYFGCRTKDGHFDAKQFQEKANWPEVKMIEIKISQGAKPGHGGVLPAAKNNQEIADIRGIEPNKDVISPPSHTTFSNAKELCLWIQQLRELSGGKPVGFKLCIGSQQEFIDICEQMLATGIKADFITVDGAEGGTGAAPIDFSDSVGMPWEPALVFVCDTLKKFGLREEIKIITATKIISAFDIFKALCLGADICNSARGMMFALGCIQSLKCHTNACPTGVATQKDSLVRGLVPEEKWKRVKNYHQETLNDFLDLLAASGCNKLSQLNRKMIHKQMGIEEKTFSEIYETKYV